jgi:hypothetical protein
MLQRAQPIRVKRINVYKEPTFFDAIFPIVKPLMTEKMNQRVGFVLLNLIKLKVLKGGDPSRVIKTNFKSENCRLCLIAPVYER